MFSKFSHLIVLYFLLLNNIPLYGKYILFIDSLVDGFCVVYIFGCYAAMKIHTQDWHKFSPLGVELVGQMVGNSI